MRNRGERQFTRQVKGMRRIREDRAQHGNDHSCPCFGKDGRTFSRFADTPTPCSSPTCCGNPRKVDGSTMQERRAATVKDWD